ncbi:SWIM zinc finger family protein [Candidatus Woesearchaeota archaeon]|nr:SWIM zinc finger family protein [Candidatus Woesearchaeota archaeon]
MQQETKQDWWDLSREQRGQLIAKTLKIVKTDKGWLVPSQRENKTYLVKFNGHEPECNCPDCELRKKKCKHIYAVEFYIKQEIDQEGNIIVTKGMRVTYPQVWKAYDTAQTNEGLLFMQLLNDLCSNLEQPTYEFGRPNHYRSNSETVFHMIKSKFRDNIRSKTQTAQTNELLCKILCHNLCVVIQEMIELGIQATFCVESQEGVYKVMQE